jgi:FMN phosphatase YigB (HAD superfamily)
MYRHIHCIAFDCFNTIFKVEAIPYEELKEYSNHVKKSDFSPFLFSEKWYQLAAFDDVASGFDLLRRKGIKIVALSNGSVELISALSEKNTLRWDYIIDLTKHGMYKPNINAYFACVKDTKIPAAHTLMVTANKSFGDLESSRSVGMQAALIRNGFPETILDLVSQIEH